MERRLRLQGVPGLAGSPCWASIPGAQEVLCKKMSLCWALILGQQNVSGQKRSPLWVEALVREEAPGQETGPCWVRGPWHPAPSLPPRAFPSSHPPLIPQTSSTLQQGPGDSWLPLLPARPPGSPPGSSRRRAGGRAAVTVAAPGGRVKQLPSPDRAPLCQQSYLWTYPSSPGERYPVQPVAATLERS